jgi:hypothetical protein
MITGVGMAHHLGGSRVRGAAMQIAAFLATAVLAHAAAAPAATTGAAEGLTTGSAVVTGTVNPGGEATTYAIEYGTSSAYGLTTAAVDAGTGTEAVPVRVTLTGLTASTTYHYRVVAVNGTETARGEDRTLRTAARPAPPTLNTPSAREITSVGATLAATVNPRGLATTARFEYGTTTGYGSVTPDVAVGAGGAAVPVTAALAGLAPGVRYNYRLVATSAAGVARSANRTFTTPRAPTGVVITPSTTRPTWGSGLSITGTVSGAASTPVALEKQDFPYTGPFTQVATATANSKGAFSVIVPPLSITARLRVVTRTTVVASSPVTTASVAVKVGLKSRRLRGGRVRIEGATWPAVPAGRVSLQRQSTTGSGKWVLVKRAVITPLDAGRSRYRFSAIARRARPTTYRVVVLARDGGAHVPGTSRSLTVPPT